VETAPGIDVNLFLGLRRPHGARGSSALAVGYGTPLGVVPPPCFAPAACAAGVSDVRRS